MALGPALAAAGSVAEACLRCFRSPDLRPARTVFHDSALDLVDAALPGDHVAVRSRAGAWHHGVYYGRGSIDGRPYVVDFWGEGEVAPAITRRPLVDFASGGTRFAVVEHATDRPLDSSLQLAVEMIASAAGRRWEALGPALRNREHFAAACRSGRCDPHDATLMGFLRCAVVHVGVAADLPP